MTQGLRHAPITKFLLGGIIINSTVASIVNVKHLFHIQIVPHVSTHLQFWRLMVWQLVYANAGEVLFSSLALYNLRTVERHMGSRKFAAFTTLAFGATSVLAPLILAAIVRPLTGGHVNIINSGLTPTIFAILYQYHALIPPSYTMRLSSILGSDQQQTAAQPGGLFLTDKIWIYALAGQLATSHMPGSLIAAATGWFVGALYHAGLMSKSWRLPAFITSRIDAQAVNTTIRTRPAVQEFRPRVAPVGAANTNLQAMGDALGTLAGTSERPDLAPPSEADVQLLMSMMSISRQEAIQNLSAANNSIERAAELLLAQAS